MWNVSNDGGCLHEAACGDAAARAICVSTFTSRARPPVRQQRQQVEDADGAVVVEVGQALAVGACTEVVEQRQ